MLTEQQFTDWQRASDLGLTDWNPEHGQLWHSWVINESGMRTDIVRNAERVAQNTGMPQVVVTRETGDSELVMPDWKIRAAMRGVAW